jgi:hypothetical protein
MFHLTVGGNSSCNGATDTLIGATAADIAGHGAIDIIVARLRLLTQESKGGHDLPRLAVPALRYLFRNPRLLYPITEGGEAFNRGDLVAGGGGSRSDARTCGVAIEMNGTSATQTGTTAVLGSGETQNVTKNPKEGHAGISLYASARSVNSDGE